MKLTLLIYIKIYSKNYIIEYNFYTLQNYFLNIPNGFPTGKNSLPKCPFKTAAAEP